MSNNAPEISSLTLLQPDDFHLHLRDGAQLAAVLPDTARQFSRALIMPNLKPPVTSTVQARAYRERICAALPSGSGFQPWMTLYLTEQTPPEEIALAQQSGQILAVKLYPAGATTNSASGVSTLRHCYPVLEAMQKLGMVLSVHGEVVDADVDVFDREAVFIDRHLIPLRRDFPELKVVFEHITTRHAAEYVRDSAGPIAATLTAQHLLYNRNALFTGGLRPHYYCLPVLKREVHRAALLAAATSGNPRFFLGTDSAPHAQGDKESDCGCAGCYTALHALELYASAFEQVGALSALEAFASFYGADFYGLPRNQQHITLYKDGFTVPGFLNYGEQKLIPLAASTQLAWRFGGLND